MAKYVIESPSFIGPIAHIMATCTVTLECRREAMLSNMISCFCTDYSKDLSKRGQSGILLYFP